MSEVEMVFSVDSELLDQVKEICAKEGVSAEDVVRSFVYSFVQDKNILVRLVQEYGQDDC